MNEISKSNFDKHEVFRIVSLVGSERMEEEEREKAHEVCTSPFSEADTGWSSSVAGSSYRHIGCDTERSGAKIASGFIYLDVKQQNVSI
jgi:hypothetical protein